jgi:hemerythrin-like domain-containing protein
MKKSRRWKDPLKRLIEDHEQISEYVENLGEMVSLRYKEKGWDKIEKFEDFFNRSIIGHFGFEEREVFPAILSSVATPESKELIGDLQAEHKRILKEVQEFQTIISENATNPGKEVLEKLDAAATKIMDSLLRHATKEDERLLPIVEKNREIFNEDGGA